jgi:uncharacterized protein
MSQEEIVRKTSEHVRLTLWHESSGHDWWHVKRVWKLASHICHEEHADSFVVQLAALLHDISDYKLNGGDVTLGPKIAQAWLEQQGVEESVTEHVCEIISEMSFKGAGVNNRMRTLEGMIVQDADRLDAIGAIGIARAFAYGGFKGSAMYSPEDGPVLHRSFAEYKERKSSTVQHFYEKLLLLKERMNTDAARRVALQRHDFMEGFLSQLFREWEGQDLESSVGKSPRTSSASD